MPTKSVTVVQEFKLATDKINRSEKLQKVNLGLQNSALSDTNLTRIPLANYSLGNYSINDSFPID